MSTTRVLLEVCVDSIESAAQALVGGASRLELCSALGEGGLTPTIGLLKAVRRLRESHPVSVPIMCLIRCRAGSFVYTAEEIRLMKEDIDVLKEAGADGFVLGALTPEGGIDLDSCAILRSACEDRPVTFHRAFDFCKQPLLEALDLVRRIGCSRLLTSGRQPDVIAGLPSLIDLCAAGRQRGIIVMPGGGVRASNVNVLLDKCRPQEIHMSASRDLEALPGMGLRKLVNAEVVREVVERLNSI